MRTTAGKQAAENDAATPSDNAAESDAQGRSYRPKEHGGLTKDGKLDGRVKTDQDNTAESGTQGSKHQPSQNGGKRLDGEQDGRMK